MEYRDEFITVIFFFFMLLLKILYFVDLFQSYRLDDDFISNSVNVQLITTKMDWYFVGIMPIAKYFVKIPFFSRFISLIKRKNCMSLPTVKTE